MSSRVKEYRGTALSNEDLEKGVLTVTYQPKAAYRWSTGKAIGRFLYELKNGKIVGRRCNECSRTVVPPRIFCEWCFRRNDQWIVLPDTGTINTFSVSYIAADTTPLKEPLIPAVIIIDGTSNAGFLHLIGEVKPELVEVDMHVKAVWREPEERKGSITDIAYFKPVKQ